MTGGCCFMVEWDSMMHSLLAFFFCMYENQNSSEKWRAWCWEVNSFRFLDVRLCPPWYDWRVMRSAPAALYTPAIPCFMQGRRVCRNWKCPKVEAEECEMLHFRAFYIVTPAGSIMVHYGVSLANPTTELMYHETLRKQPALWIL